MRHGSPKILLFESQSLWILLKQNRKIQNSNITKILCEGLRNYEEGSTSSRIKGRDIE